MKNDYYIPISSFVFPEIISAEAISPTRGDIFGLFVGRNSYPTKTTGSVPVNPVCDVLIIYSKPVTWKYTNGSLMDYPLVIKVSPSLIEARSLEKLTLPSLPQGITAWAYPKTIFFENIKNAKFLFRSNEEMLQQIRRILQYQEVKVCSVIRDLCDSFEDLDISPVELSNRVKNEIQKCVKRLSLSFSDKEKGVQTECRTGACLGYSIGKFKPSKVSADSLLNGIGSEDVSRKTIEEIYERLDAFLQRVSGYNKIGYTLNSIQIETCFLYRGRSVVSDWEELEPILRACIDFIASYPPGEWNWVGNDERFKFIRELWNKTLKNAFERKGDRPLAIEQRRKEVFRLCAYFNSPNSFRAPLNDIKTPIFRALYIVLRCGGEVEELRGMLKNTERIDYCLALYGAFKGYSYFSRIFLPKHLKIAPVAAISPSADNPGVKLVPAIEELTLEPDTDRKKPARKKKVGTSPKRKEESEPAADTPKRVSKGRSTGGKRKKIKKKDNTMELQLGN